MTANNQNANSDSAGNPPADIEQLLGRAALTAAHQKEHAGQALQAPSQAQWRAFIANKLSEQEAEPIFAWLNNNPEAYQRWLETEPVSQTTLWERLSGWLTGPQWAAGGLATAMALLLAVAVVWKLPSGADSYQGNIASYTDELSVQQRQQLQQEMQLPWEQDSEWALTASIAKAEQIAFSQGYIAVRDAITGTAKTKHQSAKNNWFDFGRWHALVQTALVDQNASRKMATLQWAASELPVLQTQLQVTDPLLSEQLQQHFSTLQRSFANTRLAAEPRLQRRLAKELSAGQRLFAAPPNPAEQ